MEQLKLNMIPNGVNPVFHASQYDKGRQIRFVLDETLSGAKVTVSYRAKDGTEHGNVQMSVSGNTITDTIPEEVLTDYGIVEGEVNIDGIGSLNFFVEVEKDAYDGGVITTQTASGPIATFETNIETAFVSLKSEINPVQDLHGYSKPWSGGGGKNKYCDIFSQYTRPYDYRLFPITLTQGQTYTLWASLKGSAVSGCTVGLIKDGTKYFHGDFVGFMIVINSSGRVQTTSSFTVDETFTNPKLVVYADTETEFNSIFANYNVQLEQGSQATSFEPYSNICPISGFNALNVTLADGDMQTVESKTVNFGQTVYGGVADVTNGKVNVTRNIVDLSTLNWVYASGAKRWEAQKTDMKNYPSRNTDIIFEKYETDITATAGSEGKGFISGLVIYVTSNDSTTRPSGNACYPLATPTEITTTPENLTAISGENNVYADTNGDTTVEYYIEV